LDYSLSIISIYVAILYNLQLPVFKDRRPLRHPLRTSGPSGRAPSSGRTGAYYIIFTPNCARGFLRFFHAASSGFQNGGKSAVECIKRKTGGV